MNSDEALKALGEYQTELDGILSRFVKTREGIHIQHQDDVRFAELALELRDLFDEEFVDGHKHSKPLVAAYNEAVSNYIGSASYHGVQSVRGVVVAAVARLRRNASALKITQKVTGASSTKSAASLEMLASRLHHVVCQLRHRREGRCTLDVEDEYDLQDLFHALLNIFFEDVRKEDSVPTHAGGASRVDFLLPEISSVVELKKTRAGLNAKELGEQLIVDIKRYKKHPDCQSLFCIVYDPDGIIINPRGIENDLYSNDRTLAVRVMIVPR
ncbi:MAG: hypothetical protein FD148_2846 [Methylocystaceae bacterium]|nr:MAG: hypothetical protein FD148_2846 [Methylocystaceae bacterium]